MKSIRIYAKEIVILALIVCAIGFASKRNDDIVPEVSVDARLADAGGAKSVKTQKKTKSAPASLFT